MKQILLKSMGTMIVLVTLYGSTSGQELRTNLFDEVDRTLVEAKEAHADVLAPKKYEEAMDAYRDACKEYKVEGELEEMKQNIHTATKKFDEAIEITKVSSVLFAQVLSARRAAINAEAYQFSIPLWIAAETEMKEAAIHWEKGDANEAKEKAKKANGIYRQAELESIKSNYLANAKRLVIEADEKKVNKEAPKTLKLAKSLLVQAEKELDVDRYDTDDARHLAKKAEYQVLLAMYVAKQTKELKNKNFTTEDFLLMTYEQLGIIGETLNMNLKFNNGVDIPVAEINTRITNEERQIDNLMAALYQSRVQNENLIALKNEQQKKQNALNDQMTEEASRARMRQKDLEFRIDRLAKIDKKFDKIQMLFTNEEALVFRQKDDVIIRLIGVNFDVAKSEIISEDYPVWTKVQKALSTFDFASFIIEGHTDSQGNDDSNLILSKYRAEAVLNYLTANSIIDRSRFTVIGFGESKPVANNETSLGRKKNRRIDIVIRPTILDTYVSGL